MPKLNIAVAVAPTIDPKSWLNESRFAWFPPGYAYAAMCTQAIPALAKVTPEDAFWIVYTVNTGARRAGHPTDIGADAEELARLRRENEALRAFADDMRFYARNEPTGLIIADDVARLDEALKACD